MYFGGFLCILSWLIATVTAQGPACGLVSPLIKVRPQDVPLSLWQPGASPYRFSAAVNEYESFQIICTGPLTNVSIDVGAPVGIESLLHSTLYYDAVNISDCNANSGLHPDPLVPHIDPFYKEARNATTTVPGGAKSRGWWVDFFVPLDTPAGDYPGVVTISSPALPEAIRLPYSLHVYSFTLPATSPYFTIFGFDDFQDSNGEGSNVTAQAYADLGLMHRLSFSNVFNRAPELYSNPPDWTTFEANWGGYVFGKDLPFGLRNTSMTAFQLPSPFCDNFTASACGAGAVADSITYWSAFYAWARSKGIQHLLFDYTVDEPEWTHTWAELAARATAVHAANPALRVLTTVTMDLAQAANMSGYIDLWVPQINNVAVKGDCYTLQGNLRPMYDTISLSNLAWYQACPSHGCSGGCTQSVDSSGEGPECTMGWPSYMIDHDLPFNRIMPWATYAYNFGGELYWSVSYAQAVGYDGWSNQWFAGGNGDGTLTYRGSPAKIGGTHEIPLASIRLKAIRDGQEDLMYMALAEAAVGRPAVMQAVQQVLVTGTSFSHEPTLMGQVRETLAGMIESKTER